MQYSQVWMVWRKAAILLTPLVLFAGLSSYAGIPRSPQETAELASALAYLAGVWQDIDNPDFFLELAGSQLLIASSGRIQEAATVLKPLDEGLLVCKDSHEVRLLLRRVAERIQFLDSTEGKERRLKRVNFKPEALSLSLDLPSPSPLSEERLLSVQREIRTRYESDQALLRRQARSKRESPPWLKDPGSSMIERKLPEVDFEIIDQWGANTSYIRNLVQEVGWIDVRRFGYPTSQEAFFLIQHSWDPALILSVLPRVRDEVDAGLMDGSVYALLFDRAQLALGRPQRFGSQVLRSAGGDVLVLPLERPEEVDARRRKWGLPPLKDYVRIFGASEVRFSTECSALSSPHTQPGSRSGM